MVQDQFWPYGASVQGGISHSGAGMGPGGRPRLIRGEAQPGAMPAPGGHQFEGLGPYARPTPTGNLGMRLPTPDFSPRYAQADERVPPQEPAEGRIPMPEYEPPEDMGWKKALLGIGLSGAANLQGLGPQTADAYFNQPTRRAEREYARDLAGYTAREATWQTYYDQLDRYERTGVAQGTLAEQERSNLEGERERRERPIVVGRDLVSPQGGPPLYEGERDIPQWKYTRGVRSMQRFGKPFTELNEQEAAEIEDEMRSTQGGLYLTADPSGTARWQDRNTALGMPGFRTTFDTASGEPRIGEAGGQQTQVPRQGDPRGMNAGQRATLNARMETELAGEFDPAEMQRIRASYEEQFVRGEQHRVGDKMSVATRDKYLEVARNQVQSEAEARALARQWSIEDGWDISAE